MERTWKGVRREQDRLESIVSHLQKLTRALARKDATGIRFERDALIRLGHKPAVDDQGRPVGPRERYYEQKKARETAANFSLEV